MNDWFSFLFHCYFYINNPNFSHLVFHSLLTKGILFWHNNHMWLGSQDLLQWNNFFVQKQTTLWNNKIFVFFIHYSKNSFAASISIVFHFHGSTIFQGRQIRVSKRKSWYVLTKWLHINTITCGFQNAVHFGQNRMSFWGCNNSFPVVIAQFVIVSPSCQ